MHHIHSASHVRQFRFVAFLLIIICLLTPIAVGLLVQSLLFENFHLAMAGSVTVLLTCVLIIPLWTQGFHTNCPLCWTPVLASMGCSKHHDARRLMGSHRLRVATSILFKDQFRCPYCNESTAL